METVKCPYCQQEHKLDNEKDKLQGCTHSAWPAGTRASGRTATLELCPCGAVAGVWVKDKNGLQLYSPYIPPTEAQPE